ncbi:MAG: ATP-binding protein [Bacteroidales bacterium]
MYSYIPRTRYIERAGPFIGKQLIKVITGQRRVGKSYLLYHLMDEVQEQHPGCNIIHIDKEKAAFDFIRDYRSLLDYITKNKKEGLNAVFIDEIQDIEQFEKALRDLYSDPAYDLYCTGSNAKMLSGELSTLLSGRFVEIEVHSLSYPEFLIFHKTKDSDESLARYLEIGGLPNLIHLDLVDHVVKDYLSSIHTTIIYKDVLRRHSIRNITFLENLVQYLAGNIGNIFSAKKISDYLKSQQVNIAPNTVLDYLGYLCNAYIIHKVPRANVVGKKVFEVGEKYYFEDLGIRNSISGYNPADIGGMIENAIYTHLRYLGYHVKVGVSGNKEIDFVAERENERIYIQASYLLHSDATIEREFGNLLNIKDNYPKFVVSMDQFTGGNSYKGIQHLHLRDFLSETRFLI